MSIKIIVEGINKILNNWCYIFLYHIVWYMISHGCVQQHINKEKKSCETMTAIPHWCGLFPSNGLEYNVWMPTPVSSVFQGTRRNSITKENRYYIQKWLGNYLQQPPYSKVLVVSSWRTGEFHGQLSLLLSAIIFKLNNNAVIILSLHVESFIKKK